MRVELSRVFSILAHELRSPLGVIQGYVRMLKMRRADDDPETRMLTAILDATGRITAVARHASELAAAHEIEPVGDVTELAVQVLLERALAGDQLPATVSLETVAGAGERLIRTHHPAALTAALTTLVIAAARQSPDVPVRVSARPEGDGTAIAIGPAPALAGLTSAAIASADAARAADRLFGAGGQGLALVLAASVLDRHQIGVGLIESASDVIVMRLPKD